MEFFPKMIVWLMVAVIALYVVPAIFMSVVASIPAWVWIVAIVAIAFVLFRRRRPRSYRHDHYHHHF
ncbi:hypothetical protein I8H84_03195 [Candidatus Saccharibacteria bacterium]|nr:hypothetical protein [Candidatus Saccharibacteria bacterium]MBH1972952.1 hypothetical protein [Candidatus Saccharibacteria bacterium]MBH1991154.1 hypothetical protein [Candidatus Saccharibacteria bacterium]